MGIKGLTTLVDRHSGQIFQELALADTTLLVDGNGLLFYLLAETQGADPLPHGGEYELIRSKISCFFKNMLRCHCRLFVVFDGSFDLDDKKHKTQLERFQQRIAEARDVLKGSHCLLLPPLALCLMKQVMTELGVCSAFSQFEADKEIAILANQWKCPVLGKDSDFYVMDLVGGYIPLTHLRWKTVNRSVLEDKSSISGQIYHLQSFCRFYGVKKDLMPLFATLAGNDYVDPSSVNAFLSEIYGVHESNSSKRQSQLAHLLHWIGDQVSCERALEEVWRHIPDKAGTETLVDKSMDMYRIRGESSCLKSYFEGDLNQSDNLSQFQLCTLLHVPAWVAAAHQRGDLSNLCINILSKQYCFSNVQVENYKQPSTWLPVKFLFAVLSGVVLADKLRAKKSGQSVTCLVYVRNGDGFQRLKINPVSSLGDFGKLPSLSEVPLLSVQQKRTLLLRVLAPNLNGSVDIDSFPPDFRLVVLATLYWVNSKESQLTEVHILALIVGWILLLALRQRRRPRSRSGHVSPPAHCPEQEIEAETVEANISVNQRRVRGSKPDPVISHGFAQWQHCVLHTLYLNELLQSPLPCYPDIAVLFNGLSMHSIYAVLKRIKETDSPQRWIPRNFFANAPVAYQLYESIREFLFSNTSQEAQLSIVTNRRKGSRRQNPQRTPSRPKPLGQESATKTDAGDTDEGEALSDADDEWAANNRYAALLQQ